MPRTPVTITLQGSGSCRIGVDFGDGNSQDLNGQLPLIVRHTYAVAGSYAIVAIPARSCGDRQTATLVVGDRPTGPQIIGLEVTSVQGARGRRSIKVTGVGSCAYTLDFGDGNSDGRNAALPDVVQHNYPAEGRYTIVATAAPPCEGVLRSTIVIGAEPGGRISQVEIRPRIAVVDQAINVTIRGEGTCRFTVDFGDGKSRAMTETLPHEFSYRYQEPGDYQIFVWTERPCGGEGTADARVRRQ
jgi:plastocyanin